MQAEPVTPLPPRPVGRTVFTQTWADLTFLHWAVEPDRVHAHLPPGVDPDVLDGTTYVGLIPFRMRHIGFRGGPALPYVGSFLETNVRLYSVDGAGRRGVVFVSLEASRLASVAAARWGPRLPYMWSRMGYRRTGTRITYTTRRRWPGPRGASSRVRVRIGDSIEPGPLEHFLTARWGLHLRDRRNRTSYWPNTHEAWSLRGAAVEDLHDELLVAAGFADLSGRAPDHVMYSPGVHATFGPRLAAAPL